MKKLIEKDKLLIQRSKENLIKCNNLTEKSKKKINRIVLNLTIIKNNSAKHAKEVLIPLFPLTSILNYVKKKDLFLIAKDKESSII